MPKKYLTVKEIARLFGVTPLTVRNWDKRGRLTAYRNPLNNYRVYKIEEVESLINLLEKKPSRIEPKNQGPRKLKIETS